ncbi:Branched-chain amino acid transport system / permease component [Candidatus Izimaplasma bacterium HR1]|uniref:ABC transporter permease n=1 Tax=Candidatus Izimoplasma sp. HR1 TaxID=1541959 RepID=UPI0004F61F7F|nr:Branched-chain amino acid transport system / permease component [Candidatus Izimaplasma bacterium HR1]
MSKSMRKNIITVASILGIILVLWIFGTDDLFFVLRRSVYIIVPLAVVAFAGLFSERSGVVNIALEGIMVFGAFIGILFMVKIQDAGMSGQLVYFLSIIVAGISGYLFSLIHAFASINMKANQVISGTALNLLAPAIALFFIKILFGGEDIIFADQFLVQDAGFLTTIPVIGPILFSKTYLSTFYAIALIIIASVVLYKTKFGLRMRACGEHPQAADAAGINVAKMRYAGVGISGFLAGIGGIIMIIPLTVAFTGTVSGYGFLALAVLISGQWKPGRIIIVAIFFGFMLNLSGAYTKIAILADAGLPDKVYSLIPFVMTLIVLAFTSRNSQAPKASGEPYDPGKR